MSLDIIVEKKIDDVLLNLDKIADGIEDVVNKEILNWLQDFTVYALAIKPWRDRTGTLRAGHKIESTEGGWRLVVNPELAGAEYDYAPILEYGLGKLTRAYPWIGPAYEAMEPEFMDRISKAIDRAIKQTLMVTRHIRMGKAETVYRYPAGTIIGGVKVGGRFAPRPR